MANNRWLGVAQSQADQKILIPKNVMPGSVWQLRVGISTFTYTYPASIEISNLTENDRAKAVVDGIIDAYEGTGADLGGGSDNTAMSLSSELYQGQWALLAVGPRDGTPLDIALTGRDPTAARIEVTELQKGTSSRNEIQEVRWPQTPTGGNAIWRFQDESASIAYNANAATVETALEGLSGIGAGNVDVTGSHSTTYRVEFKGALAGKDVDRLFVHSTDCTGTAAYTIEVTQSPAMERQTYTLGVLDGNSASLYRFAFRSAQGHFFTGSADAAKILLALQSVPTIGAGHVTVLAQDDGTTLISMVGKFIGVDASGMTLEPEGASPVITLDADAPDATPTTTIQKITFLNMPAGGTFKLTSGGDETGDITWLTTANNITTELFTTGGNFTFWGCTAAVGGIGEAWVITLVYNSSNPSVLLADIADLVGSRAIDVSVVQNSRVARNEIQQVSIATDPTGGTFTLTFGGDTTAGLAYNASAATIQTALTGLTAVGGGNAQVSGPNGGPWLVEFISGKAAAEQASITGNGASLTLPTLATVTTVQAVMPTGPNWYNNAANWSLGNVPVNTDIATYENNSVPCKYGLQGIPAFAGMDVYRSYSGTIGLKSVKDDGSPETLPTDLALTDNTGVFVLRVGLGDEGSGPSVIRIAAGTQNVQGNVLYTQQGSDAGYTCGLSGVFDDLIVGSASVGIAVKAGSTATVTKLRVRPNDQDSTVIEWGELADVGAVQLQGGSIRAGSVPSSLFVNGGECTVRGTGDCDALIVRNSRLRWLATGAIGKQGLISAMTVDGDDQALITSNGHGLLSGARVFLSGVAGIVGLPDAFYTVSVVNANSFALVGTAPEVPFGAVDPSTVSSYYQTNTARWAVAESVQLGEEGVLDMSELALLRTIGAPVVLQAASAQVLDPLVTVKNLRLQHNPGPAEDTMGLGCVLRRDERAASTATPGNPSGAGGLAVQ